MTTMYHPTQSISLSPTQLEELTKYYYETDFPGRRPATIHFAEQWLRKWLRWMKACHHSEVTYENLQQYVTKMYTDYKPKTAFEYWVSVRRFLRWLVRTGRTVNRPHEAIRLPKVRVERTINPITREEYMKLREVAAGHWMDWVILLGWNTGMSIGDCMMLRWCDIDEGKCIIKIRRIKTGTESVIPFEPDDELGRVIKARRDASPNAAPEEYVSHEAGQRVRLDSYAVSKVGCDSFRYLARKAGISTSKHFHCMRHSFVSMLANSGMSTIIATKVSGHLDPRVFARYVHTDTDALRKGVCEAKARAGNLDEVDVVPHGQVVSQLNSYLWRPKTVYIVKRGRISLPDGTPVLFVVTGDKAEGKKAVVAACDESGEIESNLRLVVDITDVRLFS